MKKNSLYIVWMVLLIGTTVSCRDEDFPNPVPATIQTTEVEGITGSSAISGGTVISDGGHKVSSRGVCWDTIPEPTLSNNLKEVGNGLGSFNVFISGLRGGTTYYLRAYATNNGGISYGETMEFKTNQVPILETDEVTDITGTSAICGGTIIEDFGLQIIEKGLCFGTEPNPSIDDTKIVLGDGPASFSGELSGLSPSSDYHVRAYTITGNGDAAYGDDVPFSTLIVDYDGNVYTSVKIGGLVWMVENYECTHFNDGTELPHSFHPDDVNKEYGASYTWYDIVKPNFAPEGWRVATDLEWRALHDFVDGVSHALKEEGTDHWNSGNGTNETGFTAYGSAHIYGAQLKAEGSWWTSDEDSPTDGIRWVIFDNQYMGKYVNDKWTRFPVRLVRDY